MLSNIIFYRDTDLGGGGEIDEVFICMEKYAALIAKQDAIAFKKWCDEKEYTQYMTTRYYRNKLLPYFTIEQLYELYKTQKI